jgi:PAS domain S-box-containing protein
MATEDLIEEIRLLKVASLRNARSMFDAKIAMLSPSIIVDISDGSIVYATLKANEQFGYEDLFGKNIQELMPLRFRSAHDHHLASFAANPQSRAMGHAQMSLVALHANGEEFNVEIGLEPLDMLGRKMAIATILKTRVGINIPEKPH